MAHRPGHGVTVSFLFPTLVAEPKLLTRCLNARSAPNSAQEEMIPKGLSP